MINKISKELAVTLKAEQYIYNTFLIVKELIENALDADASNIDLLVSEKDIIVSDDGTGISLEDLKKVGLPGHTSKEAMAFNIVKLQTSEIFTHGYRGFALASIKETCKFNITSSTDNSGVGYCLNGKNNEILKVAKSKGTTVKVSDLFVNYPVRKKSNDSTLKNQLVKISDFIESLIHLHKVNFSVKFNIKNKIREYNYKGNETNLKEYCINRYGSFYHISEDPLYWFIMFPNNSTGTQKIFANNRIVNVNLTKSIDKFLKRYVDYSLTFILNIKDKADMNISANKMDVLFQNKKIIENNIRNSIDIYFSNNCIKKVEEVKKFKESVSTIQTTLPMSNSKESDKSFNREVDESSKTIQPTFVLKEKTNIIKVEEKDAINEVVDNGLKSDNFLQKVLNTDFPLVEIKEHNVIEESSSEVEVNNIETLQNDILIEKSDFLRMKVIGQFNQGFIICVLEKNERTNLVIVDQHAADKIYNFEKLRREFSFQRQMLIVPIEVELTESQSIIIETFKSSIEKNGFNIKGNFLHSVPFYKGKILGKNDFYNLLSNIEKDPEDLNVHYCDQFRKIMAEKACRESIMIGKALNTKQLEDIVRNLAYLDLPWKCPHGRPTFNILE